LEYGIICADIIRQLKHRVWVAFVIELSSRMVSVDKVERVINLKLMKIKSTFYRTGGALSTEMKHVPIQLALQGAL
jgi:hypothetical protein